MPGFFDEEELRGARVYDIEGLLYGVLSRFVYRDGELFIAVAEPPGGPAVDVDSLLERLREAGVPVTGSEPLERLVALARASGIEVPLGGEPSGRLKGLVPVREVAVADSRRAPGGSRESVVLLRTPREARYRGRRISVERPKVPEPGEIRGRLVVSLSLGILGSAETVVVGPGEPGLRLRRHGPRGYLEWTRFLDELRRRGYTRLYERLADMWEPLTSPRISLLELGDVAETLDRLGAPPSVKKMLEDYIASWPGRGSYIDVPWNQVLKIGDIVIVK